MLILVLELKKDTIYGVGFGGDHPCAVVDTHTDIDIDPPLARRHLEENMITSIQPGAFSELANLGTL